MINRIKAVVLDILVWYALYVVVLLALYLITNGAPKVEGDPYFYKEQVNVIIKSRIFISIYMFILLSWEVVIPYFNNGQSFFKKKFNVKIVANNKINIVFRGLLKIIILNPSGIVAYMLSELLKLNKASMISDIFGVLTVICFVMVLLKKDSIYDKISKTTVKVV